MNKYKTIEQKTHKPSIEETRSPKQINNKIGRTTLVPKDQPGGFLSSNKSIVFLRSPKIAQPVINSFRSSLYESSLKRLKQQRMIISNETLIPSIMPPKKTYQSFEEQAIRQVLQERQKKHQFLPIVNRLAEQTLRNRYHSTRIEDYNESTTFQRLGFRNAEIVQKSTIEVGVGNSTFKNLKQKYLQLKHMSLNSKLKSELLDRPHYRRYQNQPQTNAVENESPLKMTKEVAEHMNRYNSRSVFQSKISGFKTTIYPAQKAHIKVPQQITHKRKQCDLEKQDYVKNFIKRKKIYSQLHPIKAEKSNESNNHYSLEKKNIESEDIFGKVDYNPQQFQKSSDCSPWQTQAANFQKF